MNSDEKEQFQQLVSRIAFLEDKVKILTEMIENDYMTKDQFMNVMHGSVAGFSSSNAHEKLFKVNKK